MKWFKHFTDAHNDNALRKVRMKYGADGYAIYWYCLELIAGDLDGHRANFELTHDAEVIGFDLKIDQLRVEEIMRFMVELGLFETSNSTITCLKLAKFIEKKSTRNVEIHRIIDQFQLITAEKEKEHLSATVGDSPRLSALDKIRLDKEKNRVDEKPSTPAKNNNIPYQKIVNSYHEILPMLPRIEKLTPKRQGYIRQLRSFFPIKKLDRPTKRKKLSQSSRVSHDLFWTNWRI